MTLAISKPTVSYHVRKLGVPCTTPARYDWREIQAFYDAGNSVRDCMARFGFSVSAWNGAVSRGAVVPRPHGMPFHELLVRGPRNRLNIKQRLIRSGLEEDRCETCGISEWRGRRLGLALHHVNGDRHDNRIENLALLCPNCHSQTNNFSGRNVGAATARRDPSPRPPGPPARASPSR